MGDAWADLSPNGRYAVLCRAALRQARTDVALSHISAANEYGAPMWDLDMTQVHLTRTDHRAGRAEAGIVQHRGRLQPGDVVHLDGVPTMSATQGRTRADHRPGRRARARRDRPPAAPQAHDAGAAARAVCIDDRVATDSSPPTWSCGWPTDGRSPSAETRARFLCFGPSSCRLRSRTTRSTTHTDARSRAWTWRGRRWGCSSSSTAGSSTSERRRAGESVDGLPDPREGREEQICELKGWAASASPGRTSSAPSRSTRRIRPDPLECSVRKRPDAQWLSGYS